jgi:hypothetical protein
MCGERPCWKERISCSELNLQEDANHAPNDQRKQCAEHSETCHGETNLETPRHYPTEEADHHKQDRKAENRTRNEITAEEGQHIQGDGDTSKYAHYSHKAVFLCGRFLFAEELETYCEDTERYPTERARVDMRKQDILAQLTPKMQPIEYTDSDSDNKDDHCCLEE